MKLLTEHPMLTALAFTTIVVAVITGLAFWRPQPAKKNEVGTDSTFIRKMVAAGTFYPKEADALNTQLEKYLNAAPKISTDSAYRILIVPHAGLDYSGAVAGVGFKQIANAKYDKFIILGASHNYQFDQAAVITGGKWETPLGDVEIDSELARKLISGDQKIVSDTKVHDKEHSLELEVIWLKKMFNNFKIVPILVSTPSEETISALAFRIAQNMDDSTLLIISTDLSHYPNYETANRVDKQTIEAILAGNITSLTQIKEPGVETKACAHEALKVAAQAAKLLKLDTPVLLKYANSGDVTSDKNRVVGYAAIGFTGKTVKLDVPQLDEGAKKEALEIAKQTLADFVTNKKLPGEITVKNPILKTPLGAFITLRKKNGDLRGCIGEFEPTQELYKVIQQKTVDAASKDPRFTPVTASELPNITLEISVMTPRQRIDDWEKIRLGTDGVVLVQGNRSGTFLPQVATDTGWSLEAFLGELCSQKAGLPRDCYKNPATEIYIYQAQVFE